MTWLLPSLHCLFFSSSTTPPSLPNILTRTNDTCRSSNAPDIPLCLHAIACFLPSASNASPLLFPHPLPTVLGKPHCLTAERVPLQYALRGSGAYLYCSTCYVALRFIIIFIFYQIWSLLRARMISLISESLLPTVGCANTSHLTSVMLYKQINKFICEDQFNFLSNYKMLPLGYVLPLNSMSKFLVSLPNPTEQRWQNISELSLHAYCTDAEVALHSGRITSLFYT